MLFERFIPYGIFELICLRNVLSFTLHESTIDIYIYTTIHYYLLKVESAVPRQRVGSARPHRQGLCAPTIQRLWPVSIPGMYCTPSPAPLQPNITSCYPSVVNFMSWPLGSERCRSRSVLLWYWATVLQLRDIRRLSIRRTSGKTVLWTSAGHKDICCTRYGWWEGDLRRRAEGHG